MDDSLLVRRGFVRGVARLVGALALLGSLVPAAGADEMAFYMKNYHPRAVVVELYSQSRAFVWPGDDKVFLLERDEKKSVPITCEAGERICWGAWLNGNAAINWGVGPDAIRSCETCCTVCTAKSTAVISLTP